MTNKTFLFIERHSVLLCFTLYAASLLSIIQGMDVTASRLRKLLETYHREEHPREGLLGGKSTTDVHLQVKIADIILKPLEMTMEIEADWSAQWSDPRLSAVAQDAPHPRDILQSLTSQVWTPDVYVRNARSIQLAEFPVLQKRLTIDKDGTLKNSMRVRAELSCPSFSSHPSQLICSAFFQTYGSQMSDVQLAWVSQTPVSISPDVSIPLHSLTEVISGYCPAYLNDAETTGDENQDIKNCVAFDLVFKPAVNFFGSEIYGASFLLVAISWVGFWIDGRNTTIRLGLGLGNVLILVVYGIGFRVINLKVGVPGNVEVWLAFCVMLVLASVIEFVFVHIFLKAMTRITKTKSSEKQIRTQRITGVGTETDMGKESANKLAQIIDNICGAVFPLIFVCFNIIYWIAY